MNAASSEVNEVTEDWESRRPLGYVKRVKKVVVIRVRLAGIQANTD